MWLVSACQVNMDIHDVAQLDRNLELEQYVAAVSKSNSPSDKKGHFIKQMRTCLPTSFKIFDADTTEWLISCSRSGSQDTC